MTLKRSTVEAGASPKRILGLVCFVASVTVTGACAAGGAEPPQGAPQSSQAFSRTPSPSLDAELIDLQAKPVAAAYGFGAAWISVDSGAADNPRVVRIDGASKKVGLTIKGPHRIDVGQDAIWGAGSPEFMGKSTLRKIDPETGKTLLAVPAPYPFDVSVGSQAVWITTMQDGVGRVDPRTGAIKLIGVPDGDYILATETAVWVSDTDTGEVLRIDPRTNKVVARVTVGSPRDIVAYKDSIWVGSDQGHVARIDTRSNRMTTITGSGDVKAITACGDAIWAPHRDNGVSRIDPATNEAEPTLPFENDLHLGIACGHNEVWITSSNDEAVYYHRLS